MNKNNFAPLPPMGWNSYDYYDTTVTEDAVKANADYMAAHLKEFGWEYIVVDIEWYAIGAGSMRDQFQYIPFADVAMDEFSRLQPDPARFPSSADGTGFTHLADYIHSLGLKFGIQSSACRYSGLWESSSVRCCFHYSFFLWICSRKNISTCEITSHRDDETTEKLCTFAAVKTTLKFDGNIYIQYCRTDSLDRKSTRLNSSHP